MRDFGLSLDDRNKVTAVVRDSQAARADVRVGDRVVALNDTPIGVSDLLSKRIAALPPGSFTIGLERGALGPNPNPNPSPSPKPYPDPTPNPNLTLTLTYNQAGIASISCTDGTMGPLQVNANPILTLS